MVEQFSRPVADGQSGLRLDVFLSQQPEVSGRTHARQLLDAGLVRVGDERVRPSLTVRSGQIVEFELGSAEEIDPLDPPGPVPEIRILYEDAWMCAIDKPVGLASHPPQSRTFREHTVASWARSQYADLPSVTEADRPGIVHRLDRETSGVMVLAKTEPALDFLRAQFKARTTNKEYRAIVFGEPRFDSDWIERAIASDPKHPERMTTVKEGGRDASTFYEVVERFGGFAHLLCRPKTGRTHQIRVHLTAIGHSLVSDRIYRSRRRQHESLPDEAPDPRRQCLHAMRLTLPHPQTHEPIEFEAPMPSDMNSLLHWLRANRPKTT